MLDVHPPDHTPHTWRDFLIHIATICVGLLIAIGLEQAVEAIHHHHQRRELEQQMQTECERNLELIKTEIAFAGAFDEYFNHCLDALQSAPPSGQTVTVTLPVNRVVIPTGMLISPSQGTWTIARAAGTVALLPPEEAKVYSRLNLAADFEQVAESSAGVARNSLASAGLRDHLALGLNAPTTLTLAQRDDLLYAFNQSQEATADLKFRLVVLEGALEAVLANVHSLEEMYPYQTRALQRENAKASTNR